LLLASVLLTGGAQDPAAAKRTNELTLAGLRPGKDALPDADARYKKKFRRTEPDGRTVWADACRKRTLELELSEKGLIQSVSVSSLSPAGDCNGKLDDSLHIALWKTGRGLKLGDPRDRVVELYGEPNSSGPSAKGSRELELLFYAFDWAGSDVPQVMEVSCERATGRVVEITLAFPSL
jgi:hypothetical protein